MRKFCISLRQHGASLINFEKKKKLNLRKKELKDIKILRYVTFSENIYTKACER